MATFDPAWFGYAALLSLLATSFAVQLSRVRIGIALSALFALPIAIFHWGGPGYVLLVGLILLTNLVLLARGWFGDAKIRFSPEEQELRRLHFEGLSAGNARRLIISEDDSVAAAPVGRSYGRMLGSSSGVDIRV